MKKIIFIVAAFALFACVKQEGEGGGSGGTTGGGSFDYATTKVRNLSVNYRLAGYSSHVLFSVYAEYPYTASGELIAGEPILRAVADSQGVFNGQLVIPTYVSQIYLQSTELGIPNVVAVPVNGANIVFDMEASAPVNVMSKATASNGRTYPDGMKILGNWNALGLPDYLVSTKQLPNGFADDVKAMLPLGADFRAAHPEFFTGNNKVIDVVEGGANSIEMTMIHDGSSLTSAIGYYTYPTGNPPASLDDVVKILALPNASLTGSGGALGSGYKVQLMYWNGSRLVETFPEGVTIGFFTMVNGFSSGNVAYSDKTYYSNNNLVAGQAQQMVLMGYKNSNKNIYVMGIETGSGLTSEQAADFRDIVVSFEASPNKALAMESNIPSNPDPEPDIENNYTEYKGTVIFEDLWPSRGDYDMNDVVVEYTSKVYTNLENKVVKTVDVFSPVNNGAGLQNGFGYQYGVSAAEFKSMNFEKSHNAPVSPQPTTPIPGAESGQFEAGQSKATLLLFSDIRSAVDKSNPVTYTITTELTSPAIHAVFGFPPYNPFAMIVYQGVEDPRSRELHLANYLPTDKADTYWFGRNDDKSVPLRGLYYISNDLYPFAVNIPVHNFKLVPEIYNAADKKTIAYMYPRYHSWASSNGVNDKDWYLYPRD